MSWESIQTIPQALEQVQAMYASKGFPWEVRYCLADLIENYKLETFDGNVVGWFEAAQGIYEDLLKQMNAYICCNRNETYLFRPAIQKALQSFQQQYSHQPVTLIQLMAELIRGEAEILHRVGQSMMLDDPTAQVRQALDGIRTKTRESADNLVFFKQEEEKFSLEHHDYAKSYTQLQAALQKAQGNASYQQQLQNHQKSMEEFKTGLQVKAQTLSSKLRALMDGLRESTDELGTIQKTILDDHLIAWKRQQQIAGNGAILEDNLDSIQLWCERQAEYIWDNRQQMKELRRLVAGKKIHGVNQADVIAELDQMIADITQLLSSLVTSTFVIEVQPPQVMKTNTKFKSTVRLLVGGKLNVQMNPPQVKVSIVAEPQANSLLRNDSVQREQNVGEILNNTGVMDYSQTTRVLSVQFRNMQLKRIKRPEKKGQECVMDEKFALLFQSQFSIGGGELMFQVWTLSLPVVVIVHGNQEPPAVATISWDNAFARPERIPFEVPDKVEWHRVAEMLNMKFQSMCDRPLTPENMQFLATKAFRGHINQDYTQARLTWQQFCKDSLADRQFTFWEWFYAIMKVTAESQMKELWKANYIIGFIGKDEARDMLLKKPDGTFLIRYSDSERGGISVSWVVRTAESGMQPQVMCLAPQSSKDFSIRSLADRLNDLGVLQYLYPDIPKDHAFSRFYTPTNESTSNGYVKPHIKITVPGVPVAEMSKMSIQSPAYFHEPIAADPDLPELTFPEFEDSNMTGYSVEEDFAAMNYDIISLLQDVPPSSNQ